MKFALSIIFTFFFVPLAARAASPGDVVINEIAWMGTTNSHFDEWIELYNNTNAEISLEGWVLYSTTDGTPNIVLEKTIPPKGFYLLERTNDTSVASIPADQIYKGDLKNSGEHLELKDAQGNLTDGVNSLGEWFAGENIAPTERKTMERKNPALASDFTNWGTSTPVGGTPKSQNSLYSVSALPPPEPQQPQPQPQQPQPPEPQALPLQEQQSLVLPPEPNPQSVVETATTTQPVEIPIITQAENPPATESQKEPRVPEVKEIKKVKVISKKVVESIISTSTPPSQHVAAIGDVAPDNKNIFLYSLAPLLALLSAGVILLLKKRLQK